MEPANTEISNYSFEKIVDTLIRLAVLALLLGWCFEIMRPFELMLIWATLIALAVYPIYQRLIKLLKGRKILAATLISIILLSIILIPSWLLSNSLIGGLDNIRQLYEEGKPIIPAPGEITKSWPSIAKPIINLWQLSSENLQAVAVEHKEQFETAGEWLLKTLGGLTKGILQLLVSIVIAGVMLVYSDAIGKSMFKLFKKLAGKQGETFANITVNTVRSVFKGVLGVSFIQAALAGAGFFIAGVPHAGLWTAACLVLAIVQVGVFPVVIPVVIYMFTVSTTTAAIFFTLWMIVVSLSDNFLKPILMGGKSSVPVMVIFIGSVGGLITAGIMGLFLGAVVLSIGYTLFISWLDTEIKSV